MTTATLPRRTTPEATGSSRARRFGRWLALGPATAPRWERPALWALILVSGVLYIWNLAISGYANSFYSAAVQAGSTNWEAFFFGSSDAGNSITVDKPPASLWIMELSVRLFGLSSWSILLPEALMGVATVFVVYLIVRRHFSAGTALVAGGVLALTPVAVEMFRFNNPDAMLLLLMALAVYLTLRGIESGRIRWVAWAGVVIGFGFLTKQLQAFVILPELAAVYYVCAPKGWLARLGHLAAAAGGVVVGAGWWVAIVTLVPASMRPYIGGSQDNSFLELTFGYNGFGRLTGNETGSVTGGQTTGAAGGGAGSWGSTGLTRLFGSDIGGQITWVLPAALIVMIAGFVVLGRRNRIDARRATLLLFSSWLVVTALVFSFAGGIFHPYYTVALAAPIAGTLAIGASLLWRARFREAPNAGTALVESGARGSWAPPTATAALPAPAPVVVRWWPRAVLAATMVVTAVWSWVLLERTSDWLPWLKFVVVVVSIAAAVLVLIPRRPGAPGSRALAASTVSLMLIGGLIAPAAYSIETMNTAHTGSIPSAGPSVSSQGGFGGGGGRGGFGGGTGTRTGGGTGTFTPPNGGAFAGGTRQGGTATQGATRGGGGGAGGLLGGSTTVSSSLTKLLLADSSKYTWVAAAVGSETAATYQLATQQAVMPLGGFNGSDPSPTLATFTAEVKAGEIHYFIGGSLGRSNGGSSASSAISAWVEKNYSSQTVGGVTLYDLTNPLSQ